MTKIESIRPFWSALFGMSIEEVEKLSNDRIFYQLYMRTTTYQDLTFREQLSHTLLAIIEGRLSTEEAFARFKVTSSGKVRILNEVTNAFSAKQLRIAANERDSEDTKKITDSAFSTDLDTGELTAAEWVEKIKEKISEGTYEGVTLSRSKKAMVLSVEHKEDSISVKLTYEKSGKGVSWVLNSDDRLAGIPEVFFPYRPEEMQKPYIADGELYSGYIREKGEDYEHRNILIKDLEDGEVEISVFTWNRGGGGLIEAKFKISN